MGVDKKFFMTKYVFQYSHIGLNLGPDTQGLEFHKSLDEGFMDIITVH